MKELEVFNSINEYRKSQGLKEYEWNHLCAEKALEHTTNMANGTIPFSHDGWSERYKQLSQEISNVKSGAENVSFSKPDMNPVDSWKKSSGHNKNMLSNGNLCGIGHVEASGSKHYYTAIFIRNE